MLFRTDIAIPAAQKPIAHQERILMLGSCFAENIAIKLTNGGMCIVSNLFGTLYNPKSIVACLTALLENRPMTEDELMPYGGLFHSMQHHGSFSSADAATCLARINESIQTGAIALREADRIILTWGTAWVYELGGQVVSNCHKMPASLFTRRKLTVEEVVSEYQTLMQHPLLAGKEWLITISPIRHLKDGLHENQLSKATLLLAADELCKMPNWSYFPAYEILCDELRDYRFYAEDMVHPSSVAVDYVWERFAATQLTNEARRAVAEWEAYHQLANHRPLHTYTPDYQKLQEAIRRKQDELLRKYPYSNPK